MNIKKNHLYAGIIILVLLIGAGAYYYKTHKSGQNPEEKILWMVDTRGLLYYPEARDEVEFIRENYKETDSLIISKVTFTSRRGNVYGLLVLPKKAEGLLPGVVLLPGAGVSKESELHLAEKIAELGAAVLTIDQRGVGEAGSLFPDLKEDLVIFSQGNEPYQHLLVYDALRSFDLLRSAPFVDPERIIIAGESLGGRVAIIATAIDKNVAGTLAISTASLKLNVGNETLSAAYAKSIDADSYIDMIAPRKLVMIHNQYDPAIPVEYAVRTYMKANDPKGFILINDTSCRHGYCDAMYPGLVESLNYLIGVSPSNSTGNSLETAN